MKQNLLKNKDIFIYLSGISSNKILSLLLVSGGIGGVWLLMLREFRLVILGIFLTLLLRYFYKLTTFPMSKLSPLLIADIIKKKKLFIVLLSFTISSYDFFVLAVWVFFIFRVFLFSAGSSLIAPLILWGYAVALGGIEYMSSKAEGDKRFGVSITFLYTQFLYFLVVGLWLIGIDPLLPMLFVLLFFSLVVTREDLLLSKKNHQA